MRPAGLLPDVDAEPHLRDLTGATDAHRETIFACIGGTRLVRSRTHLLEVVCPILGVEKGRFYHCDASHDGRGYKRAEDEPEHAGVRKQLERVLAQHPGLTAEHPYFQTKKGERWLKAYTTKASREKHLHNHRDYQFYDEALPE